MKKIRQIIPGIMNCSIRQDNVYNVAAALKSVPIFWPEKNLQELQQWSKHTAQ